MLRFTELLIHSDDVPVAARAALSSALSGPADERCDNLLEAAQILHVHTALEPEEIRDLIGLGDDCNCGLRSQA
jgi:hypothetical protein